MYIIKYTVFFVDTSMGNISDNHIMNDDVVEAQGDNHILSNIVEDITRDLLDRHVIGNEDIGECKIVVDFILKTGSEDKELTHPLS